MSMFHRRKRNNRFGCARNWKMKTYQEEERGGVWDWSKCESVIASSTSVFKVGAGIDSPCTLNPPKDHCPFLLPQGFNSFFSFIIPISPFWTILKFHFYQYATPYINNSLLFLNQSLSFRIIYIIHSQTHPDRSLPTLINKLFSF